MKNKFKYYILPIFLVCCVFSLTLQSSVINLCKENKTFVKSQNQQNTAAEEEEESHDDNESLKEVKYINQDYFSFSIQNSIDFDWNNLNLNYSTCSIKTTIPPPKNRLV